MVEPYTILTATGAVISVKNAYEKSKWCQCGHRHPKRKSKSKGFQRKKKCRACSCAAFVTQANSTELAKAKAYGNSKWGLKEGIRSIFG